ncbi:cytochrome C oxidase subunit IV family protein [Rhizobium helianthi]|uniref:Cytochrome C oxidase subunit IV family protein n=1 Tax=Rhizobium helianthi TaxID=1132695 RepID=A0ABW4M379_9HYPH
MKQHKNIWLMGRAALVMFVAMIGGLAAAQWKHEAVPFIIFVFILILTLVKSRWVIFDFMGFRNSRPRLALALLAWPVFFAVAAAMRAAMAALGVVG